MSTNFLPNYITTLLVALTCVLSSTAMFAGGGGDASSEIELIWPGVIMSGFDYEIGVRLPAEQGEKLINGKLQINVNGSTQTIDIERFRPSSTLGIRKGDLFKGWGYYGEEEFYEGKFEIYFDDPQIVNIKIGEASF